MMWSAQRLAARVSDRSSASSEARNSATSMVRRSRVQACRRVVAAPQPDPCPVVHGPVPEDIALQGAGPALLPATGRPVLLRAPYADRAGGSVRIRARMNAWYDANESLGAGP